MTAALQQGGRQVLRWWKLVALLYLVNLAAAAVVVAPLVALIGSRLLHSLESDRLFVNLDAAWVVETLYHFQFWPATALGIAMAAVGLLFFVLNTFLAGGAIAVFRREQDGFFSACARYFPRLLRLMLISLILYGIVLGLNNGITAAAGHAREASMQERPWVILHWFQLALLFGLLGVVNMIFDYAKIVCVAGERRSAIRATLAAFRFVARHPGATLSVYWMCGLFGLLFLLAYHGLSEAIGQDSAAGVVLVLILRQLYMLARMWLRLWTWSSELHVYNFNSTIVAPEPPSLAAAG